MLNKPHALIVDINCNFQKEIEFYNIFIISSFNNNKKNQDIVNRNIVLSLKINLLIWTKLNLLID